MARNGDVDLAVHDWGGDGEPLLWVHATGFCARVWDRVVAAVPRRRNFGYDQRGHGDSSKPTDPDAYAWENYAGDCLAVLDDLGVERTDAVGHSSGGATLVLAAAAAPERFGRLVLMEPIVFPPLPPDVPRQANPMAEGARRRRMDFASREDLVERLGSKPPMNTWDRRVLEDYAAHGAYDSDGGIRLKCPGSIEAEMYDHGPRHRGWDVLPEVRSETLLLHGGGRGSEPEPGELPAEYWPLLAERMPHCTLEAVPGAGHFAPMEAPEAFAAVVRGFLG